MGFMGDENVRTPNIDNLAREGVTFVNAVSGNPWCCPFRGALITGLYPHVNGVVKTPSALDPAIPTITQPFKEAGYHTAWVGKWHLDGSNCVTHYIPPERRGGFDYFMGYESTDHPNETVVFGNDSEEPTRLPGYETDALTDLFINHLERHIGGNSNEYQPFFAVLSVEPPHNPYISPTDIDGDFKYYHNPQTIKLRPNVPPGKWAEEAKSNLAGYYGMIENIDTNVGKLRAALKKMDIDRETYIIFMSDHGDCLNSHGHWFKSSPWEESIKIPFIVSCVGEGGYLQQGVSTSMINHIDIAPTTLGLCGISVPENMQGYDFSSKCLRRECKRYQKNPLPEPESAYLQQIVRKCYRHCINKQWRGVITRDGWKYVCYPNADAMLFNLNDDPYEMANLCDDTVYYRHKQRLHRLLQKYIQDTNDSFELPDIELPSDTKLLKILDQKAQEEGNA